MDPPGIPSFTNTWHNKPYAAIYPKRPEVSAKGKTVIITGAGGGIGRATAYAFEIAGAAKIVLIGRTESTLRETQSAIVCPSEVFVADVTDEKAIAAAAAATGQWDVLVLAAGYLAKPGTIANSPMEEWWKSFETNVKGSVICTQAFLKTVNPEHATIIALSAAVDFPASRLTGLSAYISSKLSLIKVMEFLAAEHPKVSAIALHPGMIDTSILRATGIDPVEHKLPLDAVELPAQFMVWLASPEAAFLNGRCVWANWDVDELKEREEEIVFGISLTPTINGWPFPKGCGDKRRGEPV
ncbi:hypothetical protein N7495_004123 [Penicillium taxi]|uniref:uncharacterized protein n=1 Tax=Penicillium taxi TaxID=168475 RepID=UPI0025450479|nr:uncharacterized protein N7495_004123 [Penicillium taxi]KAJ5899379.1 hypothetical protein N7495_004123 [Penicillium taxi]